MAPEGIPDPPPPPPIEPEDLGLKWMHIGDSQTDGRPPGPLTKSDATAFYAIYLANFPGTTPPDTSAGRYRNGGSGRRLGGTGESTTSHYLSRGERLDRTFVRQQESGGQTTTEGDGGQENPAQFKATFKAFWQLVHSITAGAKKLTQKAFSFWREATAGRNWDPYNDVLVEAVSELLAEDGIEVLVSEVPRNAKKLVELLGNDQAARDLVSYPSSHGWAYHFTGLGNVMAALSDFHALGYNVAALNLSVLESEVSAAHLQLCKDVVAFYA